MNMEDRVNQLRAEGKTEIWIENWIEGFSEGMQTLLLDKLEFRFGNAGADLAGRIREIKDAGTLRSLFRSAGLVGRIEDFERLLAPAR